MTKKRKKKVPLKKQIRRAEKRADKALSLYTRAASKLEYKVCPLCNKNPIQCCFHFVTRKRKVLRWHELNVVGACNTCNYIENYFSDLSRAWYIRRFGVAQYLALVDKAKETYAPTLEDLEKIITYYTTKKQELEAK